MFFLVECNIPPVITGVLAQIYKIILIVVPIVIVLFGSIDFVKAIVSKDQDAISKNIKPFISRLIIGVLTFFVLTIVTWLFRVIIGNVNDSSSALDCAIQILGGNSSYTPSSPGSIDLGNTSDTITNGGNCITDCTDYYQSNSCVKACQNYCKSGHVSFDATDNPCSLSTTTTTTKKGGSCISACTGYYQSTSCEQPCQDYCKNGHLTFNPNDKPCILPTMTTTVSNSAINQRPVTPSSPSGNNSSNSSSTCISNCQNTASYTADNAFISCWEDSDTTTCLNAKQSAYDNTYSSCISSCSN